MKLQINLGRYISSKNQLDVSDALSRVSAWSYGWWKYVATDSVGNVVFLYSFYSSSTGGHQRRTWDQLTSLGILPTIVLRHYSGGLQEGLETAINGEIKAIEGEIQELEAAMAKKGTHRNKNDERRANITKYGYVIKDLRRFLDEYLNKKPMPVERKTYDQSRERYAGFMPFFTKPNGVLQRNEFDSFCRLAYVVRGYRYHDAPRSIDKTLEILGVGRSNIQALTRVLAYRHVADIEAMLPDRYADKKTWEKLAGWLSGLPVNLYTLDKLHTKLVSAQNRLHFDNKSEAPSFPIPQVFESLEKIDDSGVGVKIIRNAKELRAEGRSQGHCIGGKHYVESCIRGQAVALNYRGYTFYFASNGTLKQTSGKHNAHTPAAIQDELLGMLYRESLAQNVVGQ